MSKHPPLHFGQYYHIYNRGINGQNLFYQERNYRYFLKLYAEHIFPVADTYAYCLLRNHFHLLVRIKIPEEQPFNKPKLKPNVTNQTQPSKIELNKILKPSQQFGNFFNAYSKAINRAYQRTGSLFEHPFRRIFVNSATYFTNLVVYIHQNSQWHGLIDDFREWPFSSYHTHLSSKPTRLKRETVLKWFGENNFEMGHEEWITKPPLDIEDFD